MFRVIKYIWPLLIPPVLTWTAVQFNWDAAWIIMNLSMYLVLLCTPAYKNFENIWVFILVALSAPAINGYFVERLAGYFYFDTEEYLLYITFCVGCHLVILCIEEIVFGIWTRFIWRDQCNLFDEKKLFVYKNTFE